MNIQDLSDEQLTKLAKELDSPRLRCTPIGRDVYAEVGRRNHIGAEEQANDIARTFGIMTINRSSVPSLAKCVACQVNKSADGKTHFCEHCTNKYTDKDREWILRFHGFINDQRTWQEKVSDWLGLK